MTDSNRPPTGDRRWSSRLYFLLAAVGYAVGLANVWRFPYLAGQHGGSAFVLLYLVLAAIVAIPLLIAELMIGRRGRGSAPTAVQRVAAEAGRSTHWGLLGWLGLTATFLVVTFFAVVTGWALVYLLKAGSGALAGLDAATATATFESLLAAPGAMMLGSGVVLGIATLVVARDLHRGIERAMRLLVPLLPVLLLALVAHSVLTGDIGGAVTFLFRFDLSGIDGEAALAALGQVFFSIGVGGGIWITYGSYLPEGTSIPRSALGIIAADTVVALLAGLAIFPVVFANGLDPASGPGLVFVTYPLALAGSPASGIASSAVFALLLVIALPSIIAALEGIVSALTERLGTRRVPTTCLVGATLWILGLLTLFSFNRWSGLQLPSTFGALGGKTPYELIDHLTLGFMVPISALLVALFVGWRVRRAITEETLALGSAAAFRGWLWTVRLAVPVALIWILTS